MEANQPQRLYSEYTAWSYGLPNQTPDSELATEATSINPRVVIPIALDDANDIRRALAIGEGKLDELPVAKLGQAEDCVLARALSNGWRAQVTSRETTLFHPLDGMTDEQLLRAAKTLGDLGFVGVTWGGGPVIGIDWWLQIPHTWAMTEFVIWYDRGAFPELVLGDDAEGQEIVTKFKGMIEEGVPLSQIHP